MTSEQADGAVWWIVEIGDSQLQDSDGHILLFPSEEEALQAGVAAWGQECSEYIYARSARRTV